MEITYEDYLAHYGVKGMKWGRRKDRSSSKKDGSEKTSEKSARKEKLKKAAIGAGVLVAVAGGAYLARKGLMNAKVEDVKKKGPDSKAKDFTESFSNVAFLTRGKDYGFRFLDSGGTKTPLSDLEGLFGDSVMDQSAGFFEKNGGVIGASFLDPDGRKDQAGRTIPHFVVVPKSMSKDINNLDDVVSKVWPQLKDRYPYTYDEYLSAREKGDVE